MFDKTLFPILIYLSTLLKNCHNHIDGAKLEEECKIADICRHDQVPMCGIDSCGEMRTFIDTCDMHEFNCDSKTGYELNTNHYYRFVQEVEMRRWDMGVTFNVIFMGILLMGNQKYTLWIQRGLYFVQKPVHECWVTCKRGRSFKKPAYGTDCDARNKI